MNNIEYLLTGGVVFLFGRITFDWLRNRNGKNGVTEKFCNERAGYIKKDIDELKAGMGESHTKLDKIYQALPKRNGD